MPLSLRENVKDINNEVFENKNGDGDNDNDKCIIAMATGSNQMQI